MKYFLILFLGGLSIPAYTQNTTSCPCCTENFRKFDFWVGNWEVFNSNGDLVGKNSIQIEQDSCLLRESWTSAKTNHKGSSMNFFNTKTGKWHQVWVDNTGFVLELAGTASTSKMIMESLPFEDKNGDILRHQITWTEIESGMVQQYWVTLKEDGEASQVLFDGLYKRVKASDRQD